jgi:outer membrane protein OmpA-like peptidoglycan-associated protein
MTAGNRWGFILSLLGFVAVCLLALLANNFGGGFSTLPGIQSNLGGEVAKGDYITEFAPNSRVSVTGRQVTVNLPDTVKAGFDRAALASEIEGIDGVRTVEIVGDPSVTGDAGDTDDGDTDGSEVASGSDDVDAGGSDEEEAMADDEDAVDGAGEDAMVDEDEAMDDDGGDDDGDSDAAAGLTNAECEAAAAAVAESEAVAAAAAAEAADSDDGDDTDDEYADAVVEPDDPPPLTAEGQGPSLAETIALAQCQVGFEPGTALLTDEGTAALDRLAVTIGRTGPDSIVIESHTSDEGDPDVNFLLTQDRAAAIRDYLIDKGVNADTLTAEGFGGSKPIADNATTQGRTANERTDFVVGGN